MMAAIDRVFQQGPRATESCRLSSSLLFRCLTAGLFLALSACSTAGTGSSTGLAGGTVSCKDGPRPTLDCRGVLQQFARDFKADLSVMTKVTIGAGTTTSKLIEADALSGDIVQQHYQTCSLYNACMISPQDFAAKMEKFHQLQLDVRRVTGPGAVGMPSPSPQNIQINQTNQGPRPAETMGVPAGLSAAQPPLAGPAASPAAESPSRGVDAMLDVLRSGTTALRGSNESSPVAPTGAGASAKDLDTTLTSMLEALKQAVASREPNLGSGRAVVSSFTQEGQSFVGPLGAVLQERVTSILQSQPIFNPPQRARGIAIKDLASVQNPNTPQGQAAIYGTDLAITGSYQRQGEQIALRLSALDVNGREVAQTSQVIPASTVPAVLPAAAANAAETAQRLASLAGLGPKTQGNARVEVTTNRPGAGTSFRLGEEIRYFVISSTDGYLYLFHVDAERSVTQIFPNEYQPDARIQPGAPLEVPAQGAKFRFEASPPFGLETTLAVISPSPLERQTVDELKTALSRPATARGISLKPATGQSSSVIWNATTVLIRP
jgi:Domain of unknown function (DUF4384)